jgi:Transposase IS4
VNIVREKPGLKPGVAEKIENPRHAFELYFPKQLIEIIVRHTNKAMLKDRETYGTDLQYNYDTCPEEIYAFLGLLITMGASGDSKMSVDFLWSTEFTKPIYTATMPRNRFVRLLSNVRFDDIALTEEEEKENTKRRQKDRCGLEKTVLPPVFDFADL